MTKKYTVTRPTWCDKCGHVIPKEESYYIINYKLLCESCKKKGEVKK